MTLRPGGAPWSRSSSIPGPSSPSPWASGSASTAASSCPGNAPRLPSGPGPRTPLGLCLRERIDIESGRISEEGYLSYSLLPPAALPPIHVDLYEPDRRQRSKGIGELPFDTIPAAFLQAVAQAAGAAFYSVPVGPEELAAASEDA